ncbi:rap guanine nucleotide exchange factor 1-like isoform X2 [Ptychodera flava]|uniref:rap guanine nucleotide exchange factor 1-like isoform X2 n=1 Tax=Ptychodera flava TaxID=63121 RepID=UPI003969C908
MSTKGGETPHKSHKKLSKGAGNRTLDRIKKKFLGSPKPDQPDGTLLSPNIILPDAKDKKEEKKASKPKIEENIDTLKKFEDEVSYALNWFKNTIDKNTMIMLEGSASAVLKNVADLFNHLSQLSICPYKEQSSTLMSSHNQVYQSLAKLIRWADKLLIHGLNENDSGKVDEVTSDVRNGIAELVKLSIQKLHDKEAKKSSSSQSSMTLKVDSNNRQHRASLPELPLSPKEKESLAGTAPLSVSSDLLDRVGSEDLPPPKPPLPKHRVPPLTLSNGNTYCPPSSTIPAAPPLPVKKRFSGPPSISSDVVSSGSGSPESWSMNNWNNPPASPYDNVDQAYSGRSPTSSTASIYSQDSPSHSSSGRPSSLASGGSTGAPPGPQGDIPEDEMDYTDLDKNYQIGQVIAEETAKTRQRLFHASSQIGKFASMESTMSCEQSSWTSSKAESCFTAEKRVDKTATYTVTSSVVSSRSTSSQSFTSRSVTKTGSIEASKSAFLSVAPQHLSADMSQLSLLESTLQPAHPDISRWRHSYPPEPPKLPDKKTARRQDSEYDNVPPNNENLGLSASSEDVWQLQSAEERRRMTDQNQEMVIAPPLPAKKKTIDAYIGVFRDYSEPFIDQNRRQTIYEYVCNMEYESYYQSRQFESREFDDSRSASPMPLPPLPPKKRDSTGEDMRLRYNTSPEAAMRPKITSKKKSESMIEGAAAKDNHRKQMQEKTDQPMSPSGKVADKEGEESDFDEINPLDLLDVVHLLIPKKEDEEGPDVRGGTSDVLAVHATGVSKKDFMFREAFLTTYRTFIKPGDLINKLLYRYNKFRTMSDLKCQRASKNAFFLLLRVADELIGQIEDDIIEILMDLVFQLLCDGELRLAILLRNKLLHKVEINKNACKTFKPLASLNVYARRDTLHDFHASELAEQMTILDSELFQKIEIPEVLLWAKEQSDELSPNLTIFTEHFNKMSYWCRSVILQQDKAQEREKLLAKFIKIMKHLRRLNNFNSYLALLSALDSAPVRRLEWQKQTAADLQEYCVLIDSSSSFKAYRAALAEANPPCIPYLGLILQDITFINLGNRDTLDSPELVNFSKCWQQFSILDTMRRFKQYHYSELKKNDRVIAFFNDFNDFLHEEAMWQLSEKIKPRGGKQKDPVD